MLWMKSWFEMKWRLLFGLAIPLAALFVGHLSSADVGNLAFILMFCAVFSAGSGIRTQSAFRAARGLHGSTFFTLSLPVSRLRLLSIRAAAGLIGTATVVAIIMCTLWFRLPLVRGNSTPPELLELIFAAIVCTSCFHLLAVFLSTFLDEAWQLRGSIIVVGIAWWACVKLSLPPSANIFGFLTAASPLVTHTLPWPAMTISVILSVILFLAALKVVRNREY